MSARPRDEKKLRRLRKALRRTPVTHIDLVQWLQDRRYARTGGAARKMLVDGRVHVDSHVVGRLEVPDPFAEGKTRMVPDPLILAHHRKSITVV